MGNEIGTFNPLNMSDLTRDAFRTLRMNINFSGGDKDVKMLVVTSAVPNEGKTSVSIGLGVSLAESMKNTLIIECDCRRPSVGNRLKLRPKSNWIDVLYQQATLDEAIVQTDSPNLYFLDAEPGLVHSVELLNSGRFWEMAKEIQKHFDFIIFDTPPLGSFIDAAVLAEHADGAILVVKSGSKEIRLLKETTEQLKKANARILGIVLNQVNAHHSGYYKYGDYYYRNRDKGRSEKKKDTEKTGAVRQTVNKQKISSERVVKTVPQEQSGIRKTGTRRIEEEDVEDELSWDEYLTSAKTDRTRKRTQDAKPVKTAEPSEKP